MSITCNLLSEVSVNITIYRQNVTQHERQNTPWHNPQYQLPPTPFNLGLPLPPAVAEDSGGWTCWHEAHEWHIWYSDDEAGWWPLESRGHSGWTEKEYQWTLAVHISVLCFWIMSYTVSISGLHTNRICYSTRKQWSLTTVRYWIIRPSTLASWNWSLYWGKPISSNQPINR